MMYYVRCAIAAALLGAFSALFVTPVSADILHQKQLPHAWEMVVIGDNTPTGANYTACGVRSDFDSIGSNPKVLPKGTTVRMILGKSYNASGALFGLASDFWEFPKGFKATMRFSWDNEDKVYELEVERDAEDAEMIIVSVSDIFLRDFASKNQISIKVAGEMIGGFPLRGSRSAVEALESCQKILPEWKEGSTPGWKGKSQPSEGWKPDA